MVNNILKQAAEKGLEAQTAPKDYVDETDGLLHCGVCRAPKRARLDAQTAAVVGMEFVPCDCECQKKEEEERKKREHDARILRRKKAAFPDRNMLQWTFDRDNGRQRITGTARRYVERWEKIRGGNYGLLFWGGTGCGKSFLAGCIANALLEKDVTVLMTNTAQILADLNANYDGRGEYMARLNRYELLILDDFSATRHSEHSLEQIYQIIDNRYCSKKPLIVTTNMTAGQLANPKNAVQARLYSRLKEMCVSIHFANVDFREETANRKQEELRRILRGDD